MYQWYKKQKKQKKKKKKTIKVLFSFGWMQREKDDPRPAFGEILGKFFLALRSNFWEWNGLNFVLQIYFAISLSCILIFIACIFLHSESLLQTNQPMVKLLIVGALKILTYHWSSKTSGCAISF